VRYWTPRLALHDVSEPPGLTAGPAKALVAAVELMIHDSSLVGMTMLQEPVPLGSNEMAPSAPFTSDPFGWLDRQLESWNSPLLEVVAILVASFLVAQVINVVGGHLFLRWARKTRWTLDDQLVERLRGPLVKTAVLIGMIIAVGRLGLEHEQEQDLQHVLQTLILVIWTIASLRIGKLLLNTASERNDKFSAVEGRTFPLFDNLTKVGLILIAVYIGITIWDVDPKGWITSAGIAGLAVGFAAKDTLSNLFAGVFIIADAPYQVGDFIVLESGERGRVAHIGLRSTRLMTRDDIEITIPNAIMGNARITNETSGPSPKHRIRVSVGVAYGSDVDQVRQVLLDVAASSQSVCETPEPRVRFRRFGDSALDFELLGWIPEPILRGRVLDELNAAVYKRFAAENITIPFPQRDLHVKELPSSN